jgi:CRP-like cAMP-binding protein
MDVFERAIALARCVVLAPVPAAAVLALAERATAIRVAAGELLPVRTGGGDAVLVRVSDGSLVGELAAIDEDAAPPEVIATEPTVVLRIHRDDFLDLLAEHPAAARALARELAVRLRETA